MLAEYIQFYDGFGYSNVQLGSVCPIALLSRECSSMWVAYFLDPECACLFGLKGVAWLASE